MTACATCNVCDSPGTLAGATDVARVPCHVRCFRDEVFTVWRCTNCRSLHCAEDANLAEFYAVVTNPRRVSTPLSGAAARAEVETFTQLADLRVLARGTSALRLAVQAVDRASTFVQYCITE